MDESEIYDITFEKINLIKTLWEKNRLYHENSSEYFSEAYRSICFEERMNKFGELEVEWVKISICKDKETIIGYCISTIIEAAGEVDSIHVAESERGKGIGKKLVEKHLQWMNDNNCKSIGVTVSQENASTIKFYKKLGFYPNTVYMQQLSKG